MITQTLIGLVGLLGAASASAEPLADPAAVHAALERRFQAEPRDGAWADQAEQDARARMRAPALRRAELVEAACRQDLCRVVVDLPSGVGALDFQQKLEALLPPSGVTFTQAEGDARAHVVMYHLRPGVSPEQVLSVVR